MMIKQMPQEKIYEITRCFQDRFRELEDAPRSWKSVKLVLLRKPDAAPKQGIRSYRAVALTSVMSKWCLKDRKQLHVGVFFDGDSGHHLQVLMTQLLRKHWGVAGGQEEEPVAWH